MKKEEAYKWAARQVRSKVKHHVDIVATLANTAAILKERFPHFFWVGFYFLRADHLLLGPFQGPPACVKLTLDHGVCAAAVTRRETVTVDDVHAFPGHVACNSRSNSEIVVPLFNERGELKAVLDVDSESLADFDDVDQGGLELIAGYMRKIWT